MKILEMEDFRIDSSKNLPGYLSYGRQVLGQMLEAMELYSANTAYLDWELTVGVSADKASALVGSGFVRFEDENFMALWLREYSAGWIFAVGDISLWDTESTGPDFAVGRFPIEAITNFLAGDINPDPPADMRKGKENE